MKQLYVVENFVALNTKWVRVLKCNTMRSVIGEEKNC